MTRAQRLVTTSATATGFAFGAFLLVQGVVPDRVSDPLAGAVSNLVQLLVPLLAAVVCLDASRRQVETRQRRAWALLSVGVAAWAFGQGVYVAYELLLRSHVPVPSAADMGFLGFPVFATAAAVYLPRRAMSAAANVRSALDGLVIATSLLLIAWATSVRSLLETSASDVAGLIVTTAYPVGDVVILTMVLLLLVGAERVRGRVLLPLGLGLVSFAVADIGYVFATTAGTYTSGALFDLGWVLGFLLVAVAAVLAHPVQGAVVTPLAAQSAPVPSWWGVLLPYVSLLAAGIIILVRLDDPAPLTMTETALALMLVLLVLTRQLVALSDVRTLMAALHVQHALARHLSLHDTLTGLANRVLFLDRVDHALALNRRDGGMTTVLFCDLDNFKLVNDGQGHAAGDEVLVEVAQRMSAQLREQDTLARLGGDEFAILLERSPDPGHVAHRLVTALTTPICVAGVPVRLSISIGVASVAHEPDITTAQLLRRADRAMYHVKADGKAGWRHADTLPSTDDPAGNRPTPPPHHPTVTEAEPVGLASAT